MIVLRWFHFYLAERGAAANNDGMEHKLESGRGSPLSAELLRKIDAYWRAANYLSVGQIYLYDNPLLRQPLKATHSRHMLLGHWGTTPGQNFIYVHLNRVHQDSMT